MSFRVPFLPQKPPVPKEVVEVRGFDGFSEVEMLKLVERAACGWETLWAGRITRAIAALDLGRPVTAWKIMHEGANIPLVLPRVWRVEDV